jgi:hypothetical protein
VLAACSNATLVGQTDLEAIVAAMTAPAAPLAA